MPRSSIATCASNHCRNLADGGEHAASRSGTQDLKQIHDDLDAAVLEAYGRQDLLVKGPPCSGGLRPSLANEEAPARALLGIDAHRAPLHSGPSAILPADILARGGPEGEALEQQLLTRLVALNHERAAEEKRGLIRWLRPDYQAPGAASDGHRPPLQAEYLS